MVYSISYDLNRPGQDYDDLYRAIKGLGNWCHPLDSTWFVVCNLTATQIRDRLKSASDYTDGILITTASAPAAWNGLSQEVSDWLNNNL